MAMPLTRDRNTPTREGKFLVLPVAANIRIFAGSFVAANATGHATFGAEDANLKAAGRAEEFVDNTGGADGDLTIKVRRGVFKWKNSAADPIAAADILSTCYIEDDETVSKTNNAGARSAAGKVIAVDSDGVWVETL